jgi:transcription elongation GreA/GreB family factor
MVMTRSERIGNKFARRWIVVRQGAARRRQVQRQEVKIAAAYLVRDEKSPRILRLQVMSRAFVNEDSFVEALPDRPVSEHPNLVTEQGLAMIEHSLEAARKDYGKAQAAGDREALARAARDLRYWSARRATAQLRVAARGADIVQFGHAVTIVRDDGRHQTFRIVGEDEADPARGSISHVSPLAKALLGKRVGDTVSAGKDDAEITRIA